MLPKTLNLNDPAAVHKFIGGRRRINADRHYNALDRRFRLQFLWHQNIYRNQSDLARLLGVARSTISKDIRALRKEAQILGYCPCCNRSMPSDDRRPDIEQMRALSKAARGLDRLTR